jgi:clan AA aspartic protease (TIGR02281 family)
MFGSRYHEIFPDEKTAKQHLAVADDELNRANFAEALREYETAAMNSPKDAEIRRKYAWAMFNDRRPREALEQLKLAYDLAPKSQQIQKDYSFMLEQNNEQGEAAKVLQKVVQANPKDMLTKFHLGQLYEHAGEHAKAAAIYTEFTKINPRVNGPWLGLATVQQQNGKKKEAIATLRAAITHLPGDGILRQRLGLLLADTNQKDEAIKELTRSAELEAGLAEYNSGMIASLNSGGKLEQYTVPLTPVGKSLAVEVVLNERKRVKLIVDSGVESVSLSPTLARDMNISLTSGAPVLMQTASGLSVGRKVILHSVRVGMANELMVPADIVPEGSGVQGILGMSFLRRYDFNIDAPHRTMVLRRRTD